MIKKDEIRYEIDQLRKDKMIYMLDSIALTFIFELFYVVSSVVLGFYSKALGIICLLIPLGFFIFALVGNIKRYSRIKELEKKL
jgi:hypothetical protein